MVKKKFEVMLEKVERIRVVVEATDAEAARLTALEKERRGEADAAEDADVTVKGVLELDAEKPTEPLCLCASVPLC